MSSAARMFIDGSFVDGAGNGTIQVFDPSTVAVIATVPAGEAADYGGLATQIGRRLQVFVNLDEKPIGWY